MFRSTIKTSFFDKIMLQLVLLQNHVKSILKRFERTYETFLGFSCVRSFSLTSETRWRYKVAHSDIGHAKTLQLSCPFLETFAIHFAHLGHRVALPQRLLDALQAVLGHRRHRAADVQGPAATERGGHFYYTFSTKYLEEIGYFR